MARKTSSLTDTEIKNAKAKEKPYKLFDGGGLFIEITPNGSKLWRLKYRFEGKEKKISLGSYPKVSLSEARTKQLGFKKNISEGIDPAKERKTAKKVEKAKEAKVENTFKKVSNEYLVHRPILFFLSLVT